MIVVVFLCVFPFQHPKGIQQEVNELLPVLLPTLRNELGSSVQGPPGLPVSSLYYNLYLDFREIVVFLVIVVLKVCLAMLEREASAEKSVRLD